MNNNTNNPEKIFPKGFWDIPRKQISLKDSLKDIEPIDWDEMIKKEENFITTEEAYKDVIPAEWENFSVKEEVNEYNKDGK